MNEYRDCKFERVIERFSNVSPEVSHRRYVVVEEYERENSVRMNSSCEHRSLFELRKRVFSIDTVR